MPSNQDDTHRQVELSLKDIDLSALTSGRTYYPSPAAWEDEVLYFLLVDRFSDGNEFGGFADLNGATVTGPAVQRTTPLFNVSEHAWKADRRKWFDAGKKWCGGNLAGVQGKIGYLKRLGVTAIWLSPIFKQVTGGEDYHGYGIQNFLDVDLHFGTREELRDLVSAAHSAGIRVILDIILNHAGDVFAYKGNHRYFYYQGKQWPIAGFRKNSQDPGNLPFAPVNTQAHPNAWPDEAVWPIEFQTPETWTRKGDFLSLKEIDHGLAPKDPAIAWDVLQRIREFRVALALVHLAEVYKFWIAHADIDGYRIDMARITAPTMTLTAMSYCANVCSAARSARFRAPEGTFLTRITRFTNSSKMSVPCVASISPCAAAGNTCVKSPIRVLMVISIIRSPSVVNFVGWWPGHASSPTRSTYARLTRTPAGQ